jgi:hypothetical protein
MKGAQWFDVDLETLRLREVTRNGWPDGISYKSRMKEECLESVVAFNLDILFPHEDLLLVGADFLAWKSGDVLAIDPFGYLRLMELKRAPTKLEELENQVVSYGIDRDRLPPWDVRMARVLTSFPERAELRLQGFRANQRTEKLGEGYVERHTPGALDEPWECKNRFEKAHLVSNALRATHGTPPAPPILQNTAVNSLTTRLYDMPLADIALDDPDQAVREIVAKKWGEAPSAAGTEFTLIAPDLSRRVSAGIPLEKRGARFHIINAELRHSSGQSGMERALLRWEPVHRTTTTYHIQTAVTLYQHLHEIRPEAASLQCSPSYRGFYWHDFDQVYLWVREISRGEWIVETRFDSLTEGLADLKPKWRAGMRKLRQRLREQNDEIRQSSRDKLLAPWDIDNLQPATMLFAGYYDMLEEEGFFDLGKYRWYRRPSEREM